MGLESVLSIGGSVIGSLLGSSSAKKAAKAQARAAARAEQLQKEMYDSTVERNQPFVQGGTQAFNALLDRLGVSGNTGAQGYGSFGQMPTAEQVMQEPGYEFGRSEGLKALTNALNARGMSYSGAAAKAGARYANDYASGQYGNAFNRMQSVNRDAANMLGNASSMGQNSANNTGQAGSNYANQAGNALMQGANATAAGHIAQGNIWGNMLNQGASMYKNSQNALNPYTNQINQYGLPNYAMDPYGPPGGP